MTKLVYRLTRNEKLEQMFEELTRVKNAICLTVKDFVKQYDLEGTVFMKTCRTFKEDYGNDLYYSCDFVIEVVELKQIVSKNILGKEKVKVVKTPAFDIRFMVKSSRKITFSVGVRLHDEGWYGIVKKLIAELDEHHPIYHEVEVSGDVDVADVDEIVDKWK